METIDGANNWQLVYRREADGIVLLRAVTCDGRAALPETLFGLPVVGLADHALCPGPAEGETVRIRCGPGRGEWDSRCLRELTLPPGLERVGDYALFNCAGLEVLRLHDGVRRWGGGALMNCRSLDTFHLTCTGREGETLAYLAGELPGALDVTLRWGDGRTARLIFPEYAEVYEENCPAHHFDYQIRGAGYGYHHCFDRRRLDLPAYDGLWSGLLSMEHEADQALRLAWWRLRYPLELSPRAEGAYLTYLRAHGAEALALLVGQGDAAGLTFLLERIEPDGETLSAACAHARALRATGCLAVLLEAHHRQAPGGPARSFDL